MNIASQTVNNATPLYELNFRYAKAFSNRMALKVTGSFLNATDWSAGDKRDRTNLE